MTSELGRLFKSLKKQSYHSLQDDAYSHVNLLQTEETNPHPSSNGINPTSSQENHSNGQLSSVVSSSPKDNPRHSSILVKNQSLNRLTEETANLSIDVNNANEIYENCQIVERGSHPTSPIHHRASPNSNCPSNGESSKSIIGNPVSKNSHHSGGGKLLSLFGKKFNKSSTRHLDRSSSGDSAFADKNESCNPNRYTKFPLRAGTSSAGGHTSELLEPNTITPTPDPHSRTRFEPLAQTLSDISTAPQSNSRFDLSQIQSTPQTKVYSNPHKSPSRSSTKKESFSPRNFISKSITSFGKKSGKSNRKGNSSIDRKRSQSDNNLNQNRVNLNASTSAALSAILNATSSFQNIYNGEPGHEFRNSVQAGDHFLVNLPWRTEIENNLSTTFTSDRVHPNTHNNNFDGRYVDIVSNNLSRNDRSPVYVPDVYASCSTLKRRSKSLERDAGFRINPRNSISSSSAGTLHSFTSPSSTHSENGTPKLDHQRNRCLTPEEQEDILRTISWSSSSSVPSESPPPRPEKSASLRNKILDSASSSQKQIKNPAPPLFKKPPTIGALHRSVPNSFSNSSESENYSAPPSPPPRPPSSLKPESRLIHPPPLSSSQKLPQKTLSAVERSLSPNASSSSNKETSNSTSRVQEETASYPNINSSSGSSHRKTGENELQASATSSQSSSSSSSASGSTTKSPKMSLEEARNSGFINKPSKGWLHSDKELSKDGVSFNVRYIGCLDVNTSMKSLDFDSRSLIAKECINQVCEAAGLKSVDRKRKIDRNMMRILGARPRLDNAGCDVKLTITSTCLRLTSLDTGDVVSSHEMPNISFASGGDATMLDFIAYVAKDSIVGRACFILECGSGLAQDVIITIGQAFELRFKEYIQKRPPPPRLPTDDSREYYNDLPGKQPPENTDASKDKTLNGNPDTKAVVGKVIPTLTLPLSSEVSVNLIDFEAPTPPAFGPTTQERHLESLLLGPDSPTFASVTSTATTSTGTGLGLPNSPSQPKQLQANKDGKDAFDMQPFATDLPKPLSGPDQRKQLETQSWFHGCISRSQAEKLVRNDGDFLVRESQSTPGQYVLTGLQDGSAKHLLLVDPEGVVRTKDQTFDNVIHLICHHCDNCLPIISAESMVILSTPVLRDT